MTDEEMRGLLRAQYEKRKAPAELRERLLRMEPESRRAGRSAAGRWAMRAAAIVLCAAAGLTVAANAGASAAAALQKIPVIGPIAKVVTFRNYTAEKYGTDANIATPRVTGLGDKKVEEKLNSEFERYSDALIAQYESDVKGMENGGHESVTSTYEVKADTDTHLTIVMHTVIARGDAEQIDRYYNIDKKTGKLLKLGDLFQKDADYVKTVSAYIAGELAGDPDDYFSGSEGFQKIAADQNFYVSKEGKLVIVFDEASIAPAYRGVLEFTIPTGTISGMLNGDLVH